MNLREGFTTGSCATAAAAGALMMLSRQEIIDSVEVTLPNGKSFGFELTDQFFSEDKAGCAVVKDAGDDIDVTDGVKVFAEVKSERDPGIRLEAGEGIGRVTLKGLSVPVGEPAINPVPRRMIKANLERILNEENLSGGLNVRISIPEGEKLAEKTFNPKLGILGGISVLGTTGIVRPMSNEALIKSKFLELSVLREKGTDILTLVPGNYGERFALDEYQIPEEMIIRSSNFLGEVLNEIGRLGYKRVLYMGDLGKLVKVSAGIFQTHSKVSDARAEIMAANAASLGADTALVNRLLEIKTTVEAVEIIRNNGLDKVFEIIAKKVKKRCEEYLKGISVEVVLFSSGTGLLYQTEGVDLFLEELKNEKIT